MVSYTIGSSTSSAGSDDQESQRRPRVNLLWIRSRRTHTAKDAHYSRHRRGWSWSTCDRRWTTPTVGNAVGPTRWVFSGHIAST